MMTLMLDQTHATDGPAVNHRQNDAELFFLMQLDPSTLIDGVRIDDGYLADDIIMTGGMRETCPICKTVHLKLVLRQEHVKREHLFCEKCTRCFDARHQDGSLAVSIADTI